MEAEQAGGGEAGEVSRFLVLLRGCARRLRAASPVLALGTVSLPRPIPPRVRPRAARAEAGEGEDGRMKSAIGIGALLMDGLGDTIRVSLTEDPEYEMDPCGWVPRAGVAFRAGGCGLRPDEMELQVPQAA